MGGKRFTVVLGVLILVFVSGCATNRGIIELKVPNAAATVEKSGHTVFVASVSDKRQFAENPKEADIPSLGFGGAAAATEEVRKRAIARKRNAYGKALGDILLSEGQSVETVVRAALEKALLEEGYTIVPAASVKADTLVIDAEIIRFWSWMNMGFWKITLLTDIEVKLLLKQPAQQVKEVYVHAEEQFAGASGGNWIKVMNMGLEKFNEAIRAEFAD